MDDQSQQKYFAAALSAGTFNSVNDAPFFLSGAYSQCNHMKGKKGTLKENHGTKVAKVPPNRKTTTLQDFTVQEK